MSTPAKVDMPIKLLVFSKHGVCQTRTNATTNLKIPTRTRGTFFRSYVTRYKSIIEYFLPDNPRSIQVMKDLQRDTFVPKQLHPMFYSTINYSSQSQIQAVYIHYPIYYTGGSFLLAFFGGEISRNKQDYLQSCMQKRAYRVRNHSHNIFRRFLGQTRNSMVLLVNQALKITRGRAGKEARERY